MNLLTFLLIRHPIFSLELNVFLQNAFIVINDA